MKKTLKKKNLQNIFFSKKKEIRFENKKTNEKKQLKKNIFLKKNNIFVFGLKPILLRVSRLFDVCPLC